MNKIKVLSEQEAQKIAAGEVVERPASIVKEIIENSIDAGSTQISLFIKNGGKDLIRIVDNGCGMSLADAKLCFRAHATSKIEKIDDLERIASFGFRGEALASISAVSKITLITKEKTSNDNDLGINLELIAGNFSNEEKISCTIGTDLQIKELFYNTPVRKKFLKEEETEWNQILGIFQAFCLSHLSIHFKLFRDEKLVLNLPAVENIKDRTSQIWGHNFAQNLIEINKDKNKELDALKIFGYISNHNFWRYGRQYIFFFVNKRAVKNKELSQTLLKGYLNVLPPARFPAAFIFIELENNLVDINVHPRKEEVKFAKPVTIQNYLQKLITQSLANNLNQKLSNTTQKISDTYYPKAEIQKPIVNLTQPSAESAKTNALFSEPKILFSKNFEEPIVSNFQQSNLQEIFLPQKEESFYDNSKIIGQLLKTYILVDTGEELTIIDQHAAHERILYEKFLHKFEKKDGIALIFPEIINLAPSQIEVILKEKDFFYLQGIELEQIGQNQIAIKTSPPKIQNQDLKDIILQAINFIEENEQLEEETFRKKLNEHVHSHMACKMAVKAGDELPLSMMQRIISDLKKTQNRFICVHGRPTTWTIPKEELEKKFRRK
jgi:DNA mismatch repair protein MutL